jgi:Uma2 family endonuclease
LIRGELVEITPSDVEHGKYAYRVARRVILFLGEDEYLEDRFAETGFLVTHDPDTVLAPDVAFVRPDKLDPTRDQTRFLSSAPDLVVEVVSPSDRYSEVLDKVLLYLDAGTQLVWIIDPRRKAVTVYGPDRAARMLVDGEVLDGGELLPGFELPVAEIVR